MMPMNAMMMGRRGRQCRTTMTMTTMRERGACRICRSVPPISERLPRLLPGPHLLHLPTTLLTTLLMTTLLTILLPTTTTMTIRPTRPTPLLLLPLQRRRRQEKFSPAAAVEGTGRRPRRQWTPLPPPLLLPLLPWEGTAITSRGTRRGCHSAPSPTLLLLLPCTPALGGAGTMPCLKPRHGPKEVMQMEEVVREKLTTRRRGAASGGGCWIRDPACMYLDLLPLLHLPLLPLHLPLHLPPLLLLLDLSPPPSPLPPSAPPSEGRGAGPEQRRQTQPRQPQQPISLPISLWVEEAQRA
mmetsp:Transcript_35858/g.78561  ORF Transcript_35858/g.78561 Transcript_35858/m.78561 type:complete len:298 (+) Transcript_35858:262-1155(+)